MAVDIAPILSLISQRIVAAPSSVDAPTAAGKTICLTRYREALDTELELRANLQRLGYTSPVIDHAVLEAQLARGFDLFSDHLSALREAYNKEIISYPELKTQLLTLVKDQAKALELLELWDYLKMPKPSAVTPDKVASLTVAQLLASYTAGALTRDDLVAELTERKYDAGDIAILIRTEETRAAKPSAAKRPTLTIADLNALYALGAITADDLRAELIAREYSPEDADAKVLIQVSKQMARLA